MSRKSKVLDNLSSIISDKYIINENEIENVNHPVLKYRACLRS